MVQDPRDECCSIPQCEEQHKEDQMSFVDAFLVNNHKGSFVESFVPKREVEQEENQDVLGLSPPEDGGS